MLRGWIGTVLDRAELTGVGQHAFGKQEASGQLAIRAGRTHDDGKRAPVQPDLERLFGGGAIGRTAQFVSAHASDVDGAKRAISHWGDFDQPLGYKSSCASRWAWQCYRRYYRASMNMDPTWLFLSLIPSAIGFVLLVYGKKQGRWPHLVAGLALSVYPWV